jgi:hypothetical protein
LIIFRREEDMEYKIYDLINLAETVIITLKQPEDDFEFLVQGIRNVRRKLKNVYGDDETANLILDKLPDFLDLSEIIRKYYLGMLEEKRG